LYLAITKLRHRANPPKPDTPEGIKQTSEMQETSNTFGVTPKVIILVSAFFA